MEASTTWLFPDPRIPRQHTPSKTLQNGISSKILIFFSFRFDFDKKTWNFGLKLPLLNIKAQYNLKGKILVLPLVGHGPCDLRLLNVYTQVSTDVDFPKIEGREIVKIEKMQVNFDVGGMKVKFHNLFNGNKVLGNKQFLIN